MNNIIEGVDPTEAEILNYAVSDDALERAAGNGQRNVANPTLPSAIICIPFVEAKQRSK